MPVQHRGHRRLRVGRHRCRLECDGYAELPSAAQQRLHRRHIHLQLDQQHGWAHALGACRAVISAESAESLRDGIVAQVTVGLGAYD